MKAYATWQKRLSFKGTADTGFTVPLGALAAVGGDDDGFHPVELIAVGLAGCTAMDVVSILQKKRQDVTAFEVKVNAERAEDHPRVFTGVIIEYFVTGHNVQEAAVMRAIELSATRYCPAQAMFEKVFPMVLKYHIYEDIGDGKRTLAKRGAYSQPIEKV